MIRTRKRWIEMAMVVLMLSTLLYPLAGNDTVARAASTSPEDYNISIKCDVTEVKVGDIVNVTICNEGEAIRWLDGYIGYNGEVLEIVNYTGAKENRSVGLNDSFSDEEQVVKLLSVFDISNIDKGGVIAIVSFKVKKEFVTEEMKFTYFEVGDTVSYQLFDENDYYSCSIYYNENVNNTNTLPENNTTNLSFLPEEIVEYTMDGDCKIAFLLEKKKVKKGEKVTIALQNRGIDLKWIEMYWSCNEKIMSNYDVKPLLNNWFSYKNETDQWWESSSLSISAKAGQIIAQISFTVDEEFSSTDILFEYISVFDSYNEKYFSKDDDFIFLTINGYADENPTPAPTTLTTATPATTVSPLPTATPTTTTHLFTDSNYTESAKETMVSAFANGSTVKTASGKKNYKSTTLYTDITASQYQVTDKKGKTKTSQER